MFITPLETAGGGENSRQGPSRSAGFWDRNPSDRPMAEWLLPALVGATAIGIGAWLLRRRSATPTDLERRAEEALAAALSPGVGTHLESPARLHTVDRDSVPPIDRSGQRSAVSRYDDPSRSIDGDETRVVPRIEIPLETMDAPRPSLAAAYVADAIEAVHPIVSADARVSRYAIEFAYGPGGLLVGRERLRIAVPGEVADRLVEDDRFPVRDVERAIERADEREGTLTIRTD